MVYFVKSVALHRRRNRVAMLHAHNLPASPRKTCLIMLVPPDWQKIIPIIKCNAIQQYILLIGSDWHLL